jgi:hypothetical protein
MMKGADKTTKISSEKVQSEHRPILGAMLAEIHCGQSS